MSRKKIVNDSLKGFVVRENEKERLFQICRKYDVTIFYPELINDEKHHYLWGIHNNSIGLIGTFIMKKLTDKNDIFKSLDELEYYLQTR